MKFINRLILSLKYRTKKLKYKFISFYNYIIKKCMKPPIVKNTEETINKIIIDKCSVSRYGEGEFKLMYGKDLLFQNSSIDLVNRMNEVINNPLENHIICIPNVFENINRFSNKAYKFWEEYMNTDRSKIYKLLNRDYEYYDALMTRVYMDYKYKDKSEYLFNQLKKIWEKRKITIIEGYESRLGIGNDLFDNAESIRRILCPSKHAFSKYDDILNRVQKEDKNDLILVALGPTATVLSYDLAKLGYQAIDIGHIDIEYEWFLQGVLEKCAIKNKFVGEVVNGCSVDEISDYIYESQIVSKL